MVGEGQMPNQNYSRVEFAADLGLGPFVSAFVDFSSQGISFGGPPINIQIYGGTPDDKSQKVEVGEFQRTTVHADGKVVTHLATSAHLQELADFDQNTPPLAQWDSP